MRAARHGQTSATVLIMTPGFLFCVCPDPALLHSLVEKTLHTVLSSGTFPERLVFWGDEGLPPRFWEALTIQGFMPQRKILVVRNAQMLPADSWRTLSKTLGHPHEQAIPVLCLEGTWEKGLPKLPAFINKLACVSFAKRQRWWHEMPGLASPSAVQAYIAEIAAKQGLVLAEGVRERLAEALPPDAAAIDSELRKLALYAASHCPAGSPPTLDRQALELIGNTPDLDVFALLRNLQGKNPTVIWKSLAGQRSEELVFPLMGLLQREARLLWQTLSGEAFPRDAEKRRPLATRLGINGIATLWDALHNAERSIKTGEKSPDQALDELIGHVTLLFHPN